MVRPVLEKDPSQQVVVLGRMLRQVDIDERYARKRKRVLKQKISDLMAEFQKEVVQGREANGA